MSKSNDRLLSRLEYISWRNVSICWFNFSVSVLSSVTFFLKVSTRAYCSEINKQIFFKEILHHITLSHIQLYLYYLV